MKSPERLGSFQHPIQGNSQCLCRNSKLKGGDLQLGFNWGATVQTCTTPLLQSNSRVESSLSAGVWLQSTCSVLKWVQLYLNKISLPPAIVQAPFSPERPHSKSLKKDYIARDWSTRASAFDCSPIYNVPYGSSCRWWSSKRMVPLGSLEHCLTRPHGWRLGKQELINDELHNQALLQGRAPADLFWVSFLVPCDCAP